MILREYQSEAVAAVLAGLSARPGENPAVVLPTGAGKTVIFAALLRRVVESSLFPRVAVLAHRVELLDQAAQKILRAWPQAPVGVWSAGLGAHQFAAPLVVAGVQTAAAAPEKLGPRDLVIVDECHRIPFSGDGQYRRVLATAGAAGGRVVGFSATPTRLDGGHVCGKTSLLHYVAYQANPAELAALDWLVLPKYFAPAAAQADLAGVKITAGEFNAAAAAERAEVARPAAVADALGRLAGRQAALWFCADVGHAERVAAALLADCRGGVAVVTGATPPEQRRAALAGFAAGAVRHLVNVDVLTEGFDAPNIDAVVLLRPTASAARFVQMVGRGFRPAPGKADFLCLDYGGNVFRHGFAEFVFLTAPGQRLAQRGDGPLAKACPACGAAVLVAERTCADCGFAWPPPPARKPADQKLAATAFSQQVQRVEFRAHLSAAGNESVRVEYYCGGNSVFSEYLNPASKFAFLRRKSRERLIEFGVLPPYPAALRELAGALQKTCTRAPREVQVTRDGQYWQVVGVRW